MSEKKKHLIKLVHVAKSQLQMDDATYRHALELSTGKTSSKKCTIQELECFMKHLKSKGFNTKKKANKHTANKPNVAQTKKAQINKIEALLADNNLPWSYAESIAQKMYKKEYLTWCTGRQLTGIITALIKQFGDATLSLKKAGEKNE